MPEFEGESAVWQVGNFQTGAGKRRVHGFRNGIHVSYLNDSLDGRGQVPAIMAENRRAGLGEWPPGGVRFDYAHVGVPLAGLAAVRAAAHALVRRHVLALIEEGLWHWPELYSVAVSGPPEAAAGVRATVDEVCRAAQEAGGTAEYCHGVGWRLAHLMEREHGAAGLAVLRRLKAALDPAGILNPGKGGL